MFRTKEENDRTSQSLSSKAGTGPGPLSAAWLLLFGRSSFWLVGRGSAQWSPSGMIYARAWPFLQASGSFQTYRDLQTSWSNLVPRGQQANKTLKQIKQILFQLGFFCSRIVWNDRLPKRISDQKVWISSQFLFHEGLQGRHTVNHVRNRLPDFLRLLTFQEST